MKWSCLVHRFAENTASFKSPTLGLAAANALIGPVLSFSQMVNVVYFINGYVGIMVLVMVSTGRRLVCRRGV